MPFFVFCILALIPLLLTAQHQIKFDRLGTDDGLSNSSVLSVVQDSSGFIWIGTRHGLNRYDTRTIKTFNQSPFDGSLSSSDYLNTMLVDSKGVLWVGTAGGLNRYDAAKEVFITYGSSQIDARRISSNTILSLLEDSQKRLWVGTRWGVNILQANGSFKSAWKDKAFHVLTKSVDGGIWASTSDGLKKITFDGQKLDIQLFEHINRQIGISDGGCKIAAIFEDEGGLIWIGTDKNGLFMFNPRTHKLRHFKPDGGRNNIKSNNIRKIIKDDSGNYWIGTLDGLSIYNPISDRFTNYQNNPHDPNSLSHNSIYEVFQDNYGSIWIGTYYGGVSIVHPNHTNFDIYQYDTNGSGLSSNIVGAIVEDAQHNLWIGTEGGGLNYYDRATGLFRHFPHDPNNPNSINSSLIKSAFLDNYGALWIGTFQGGLNQYDPKTGKFVHYRNDSKDTGAISSNYVCAILEDSQQRFWVGTGNGLNLFDRNKQTFTKVDKHYDIKNTHLNANITGLFEDKEHTLWVATGTGVYFLEKNSRFFQSVFKEESKEMNFVVADRKGRIWMGVYYGGLWRYDQKKGQTISYTTQQGLPSDNVVGLLEDHEGVLWVSTSKGLCRFDPDSTLFRNYTISDGLPSNDFNYNSFFKDSQGRLLFGTYNGLVSFTPVQIKQNRHIPPVHITGLKLFNQPVEIQGTDGLLKNSLNSSQKITFKYTQNVFSIDFAVLNYIKPDKNSYAFILEGFDKDWNFVDIPSATYTNLPPGNYTFRAKGTNNDGIWSAPRVLAIKVLPPLWKTWWAYLLYAVCLLAILMVFIRYLVMRALLKREHEVNQMKLGFFTNVSHEIRTPLTLILAPLERLIHHTVENPIVNKELVQVKSNADRLLRLVTELMDFRKAESGFMKLLISHHDIVSFTRDIFMSFQDMAENKQIRYRMKTNVAESWIYFDKIQLEKVLFNLLSNAFKFTPDGGEINVNIAAREEQLQISVTDNGPGISPEEQKKLFTNFYQIQDLDRYHIGSGVGLALSKNIIELHKGTIHLKSESVLGNPNTIALTTFTVTLLKGKTHFDEKQISFTAQQLVDEPLLYKPEEIIVNTVTREKQIAKKYSILVVEDNLELRRFIVKTLEGEYTVMEAPDGQEALDIALSDLPDLVISDVMMPTMDGLDLCRYLKSDERSNHIPVILLTARAAYNHHVNGLKTGADIYMVKPFGIELLQLNVANLIANRVTLRQKYMQMVKLEPTNQPIDNMDKVFLDKLIRIIEEKMENSSFDIPQLADKIGMSQPVLYKKIRALTDMSVNEFIKSIRLKRAAQLLNQKTLTIAEIAYTVGFSDRKYFSKEFKKQFGKTPTDYVKD